MIKHTPIPTAALLAGGLATRMRPMTEKIPKALLEVAGKPFIEHQLNLFRQNGLKRVVICAGFLGEQIEDFVGDGCQFGLDVVFSMDGPKLLGTAGALRQALHLLGDHFFVVYGDSYLDIPFQPVAEAFHQAQKPGLMVVFRNENQWDTSNVEFRDGAILRYDKKVQTPAMKYIDYGVGLLRAEDIAHWPEEGAFDLADLYSDLVLKQQMAGFEAQNRFYEIGTPAGLAETDAFLKTRKEIL